MSVLLMNNDMDVEYLSFRKRKPHRWVNDADMKFTLYEEDKTTPVAGAENIAMNYLAGTNGDYQGVIQGTVTLTENAIYYIKIFCTGSYATMFVIEYRKVKAIRRLK